jgi:hypothetical protein
MLINVQSMLRVGNTLVPLMVMSDRTYLSNLAGDKQVWPVYMTIGHRSSKLRQMPSTHSVVMVTLLPIPIKNKKIPLRRLPEKQQTTREMLNEVLWCVLKPLACNQNPSSGIRSYNVLCADCNFRRWKPV